MRNTSSQWNTIVSNGDFSFEAKARIYSRDGTTFEDYTEISAPKIERTLMSGPATVGGCHSATLSVSILTNHLIPRSAKIEILGRVKNDTLVSEYLSFGTFYVNQRNSDYNGIVTLNCYDSMLKANKRYDKFYSSTDGWPKTMRTVVTDIASRMGLSIDSDTVIRSGSYYKVPYPSNLTMADVLGYIAGCHFGNWIITEDNKLKLVPIKMIKQNEAENIPVVLSSLSEGEDVIISGITSTNKDGLKTNYGSISGLIVDLGQNPYANDNICNDVCYTYINDANGALFGLYYKPFTAMGAVFNPALQLGDTVKIGDSEETGNEIYGVITSEKLTLDIVFSADLESPGNDDFTAEYPYQSETDKKINQVESGLKDSITAVERNTDYYREAEESFSKTMAGGLGLFKTEEKTDNGSVITYLHNKDLLEDSTFIAKFDAEGFAVADSWKGSNTIWKNGLSIKNGEGSFVMREISAYKISADMIKAGSVTAEKINVDDLSALNATIGGFCIAGNDEASNGFWSNSISSIIKTDQSKVDSANPEYAVFLRGQSVGNDGNLHGAYKPTNAVFGVKERTDSSKTWDESSYTFYVRADGFVKATNADIIGKISAQSGSIAGFEIADENTSPSNGFWKNSLSSVNNDGNNYYAVFMRNTGIAGNVAIGVKTITKTSKPTITDWNNNSTYVFAITNKGKLTATNAEITGKITATSGSFECSDGTAKTVISNGEAKFYTTTGSSVKQYGLIKATADGNTGSTAPMFCFQSNATNSAGVSISASKDSWYIMYKTPIKDNDVTPTTAHLFWGNMHFKNNVYTVGTVYTSGNFILCGNTKYLHGTTSTGTRIQLIGMSSGNNIVVGNEDAPNNLNLYTSNTINLSANTIKANNTTLATGSDRRIKNSISCLDEKYIRFFERLEPVKFKYNDGKSGRFHLGFIAQDVLSALENSGLTSMDFAGYVKTDSENEDLDGYELALRYSEFPALNTYMIQICLQKIADLYSQVQSLKQKG